MKIIQSNLAEQDIDSAVDYYLLESATLANDFVDALEQAFEHIREYPATGSTRYAYELDLPNLRSWILTRFPYTVFYFEQKDHIEVIRVLHSKMDIPSWMNLSN